MDMKIEQRMGAINGVNKFKDELKSAIESKTGWGKNELSKVVDIIASTLIERFSDCSTLVLDNPHSSITSRPTGGG
jgi:hypothetical protein